jgi:hypothetical protein
MWLGRPPPRPTVWMPVNVVPRSAATVAIDTFITELSSVISN